MESECARKYERAQRQSSRDREIRAMRVITVITVITVIRGLIHSSTPPVDMDD